MLQTTFSSKSYAERLFSRQCGTNV